LAHHNTVFAQLLKLVPRHEFETLAKTHHRGRSLRRINRWSQFVALALAQLGGRQSLRDIVGNLAAQAASLYHLGCRAVTRTTLARVNEQQPFTFYEALFAKLYARCQGVAPRHRFRFKNKLYSLDASLIDLSLKLFPGAHYALGKAAMKLHVGLDHDGYLPAFATVTPGKRADIAIGRTVDFPRGSIVVCDKGYTDYRWFKMLDNQGIFFVTRLRQNAKPRTLRRHAFPEGRGITSDHTVRLAGIKPTKLGLPSLRRVGYRDPATGKHYVFLTNVFHLSATTIATLYQERWQIELFFKWLKQNLKIKSFLGLSTNAVLTQIWIALCMYLLLAFLKFVSQLGASMQQLLRLLQLNLFIKRDLVALLRGDPPDRSLSDHQLRLSFA
jgi:putative transposase